MQGCQCREAWTQESHSEEPCAAYCCNPDQDSGGEWCFVDQPGCEGSAWGYCAMQVDQPAIAAPSNDAPVAMLTEAGCPCQESWQYQDSPQCEAYCCNPDGDPGGPWCFVEDPLCEGGGKWGYCVDGPADAATSLVAAASTTAPAAAAGLPSGVRGTSAGCRCLSAWTHVSDRVWPRCEDYCCNPSADADGEWCYVESTECQGSDWGYCAAGDLAEEGAGILASAPAASSVLVSAGFTIVVSDVTPFASVGTAEAFRRGVSQVLEGVDPAMVRILEIAASAGRRRLGAAGLAGGGLTGGLAVSGEVAVTYDLVFPGAGNAAAAAAVAALGADEEALRAALATALREAGVSSEVREVRLFEPVLIADVFLPSGRLPGEITAQLPAPSAWARPVLTSTAAPLQTGGTSTSPSTPSAIGIGIHSANSSVGIVANVAMGGRMALGATVLIIASFVSANGWE